MTATFIAAGIAHAGAPKAATSGPQITSVHLSATATVRVKPTELVAVMQGRNEDPSPETAQRRLNGLMQRARRITAAAKGLTTRFEGYSTNRRTNGAGETVSWSAQDDLEIRGKNASTVLSVVTRLQGLGLETKGMDWRVTDAAAAKAHDRAMVEALHRLRDEAGTAAAALNMRVLGFKTIDMSSSRPPRYLQARAVAMAATRRPPRPIATRHAQKITAHVSATAMMVQLPAQHG